MTDETAANPLLDMTGLPRFSAVRPEHIGPAIESLLADFRALIERLEDPAVPATWDGFVQPIEDMNERLSRAWGVAGHLHGVLDSPELREAYNATQPQVVHFYTELGQNAALFAKFKALAASPQFAALGRAERRIVENELRDFRLSGAELAPADKARLIAIHEELARLGTQFSENVLDSTNAFALYLEDESLLAGVPRDTLQNARDAAARKGREGWKLTLQAPCYMALMQYADKRELREVMYRAFVTRASEEFERALALAAEFQTRHAGGSPAAAARAPAPQQPVSGLDNSGVIRRMLVLRRESARLLGYGSFAELSLVPKMAGSPREVLSFLEDLAQKALPFARRDKAELEAFARDELGLQTLQAWDVAYASEKLRNRRYAYSEQEVKQYFPEHKVLEGMFRVAQQLYGVRIEPDQGQVWDAGVRLFRIVAAPGAKRTGGELLGRFYLDPYARETKRGGAWMDDAITRRMTAAGVQAPVAYLVCNFSPPAGDGPTLLTHEEVLTLFHEFGHGLHHLMSRVDPFGVSGIRGVEWDAIELPSQFMENFFWEWEVLCGLTAHAETGEPLPRTLYDRMLAAKNFQAGMQTVRQIEFAMFDMLLHHCFDPDGEQSVQALLEDVRAKVAVLLPPAFNRFAHSFGHLFAGAAYAAGYYSYKWAEVLSADAYSLFQEKRDPEHGVLDPATGARFLEEILSVGGSRPAIESFKAFRGREPRVEALLRHSGMIEA